MKKLFLILLLIPALGVTSCVKQKNCDCGLTGKFIYYEKPEEIIYCGYPKDVNALFISDNTDSWYYITGSIPNKYKINDTINVSLCLKEVKRDWCLAFGVSVIYNLTCIEKED